MKTSKSMMDLLCMTRSASIFDEVANLLVMRIRAAMQVPSRADEETEAQFRAIREKLDHYFPRFQDRYASLLAAHLPRKPADVMEGLRTEPMQRFFAASPAIDRTLSLELQQLALDMVKSVCAPQAS